MSPISVLSLYHSFTFYMLEDLLDYFLTVQESASFMLPLRSKLNSYLTVAIYGLFSITTFYAAFMSLAFSVFKTFFFFHVGFCIFCS